MCTFLPFFPTHVNVTIYRNLKPHFCDTSFFRILYFRQLFCVCLFFINNFVNVLFGIINGFLKFEIHTQNKIRKNGTFAKMRFQISENRFFDVHFFLYFFCVRFIKAAEGIENFFQLLLNFKHIRTIFLRCYCPTLSIV